MKHIVIIPAVNPDYLAGLCDSMRRNEELPQDIFVINNSGTDLRSTDVIRAVLTPPKRLGVNASWNLGIQFAVDHDYDLVSMFNDDIVLEDRFFVKLHRVARNLPNSAVFCPETVPPVESLDHPSHAVACMEMQRREGWAWTATGEFLRGTRPIPDNLITFFGDDWLWYEAQRMGKVWMKMIGNRIWHAGSVSVNKFDLQKTLVEEREKFHRWILGDNF